MRAPQRTSELDRGSRIPTREGSRQRHPISLCVLPLYHAPKPDQGGSCTSGYSGPVLWWFSNFPISSVPGGNSSAGNLSRDQALYQVRVMAGSRGNNSHQLLHRATVASSTGPFSSRARWGDIRAIHGLLGPLSRPPGMVWEPCLWPQAGAGLGWGDA